MPKRQKFGTADVIEGTPGDDELIGTSGNDTIHGREGHDAIFGRQGNDRLNGNRGNDVLNGDEGNDRLYGHAGEDFLQGGLGADLMEGGDDDDLLVGIDGGKASGDTLIGGQGDDAYEIDAMDKVVERAGQGNDTVMVDFDYTLANHIENLSLRGGNGDADINGTGNSDDNIIWGSEGANVIHGGGGDDKIYAGEESDTGEKDVLYGDAGDDYLIASSGFVNADLYGGTGDDGYEIFSGGENIFELAGEGTDTVYSHNDATLGANLENLVLLEDFFANDPTSTIYTGRGNELDNRIIAQTNQYMVNLYGGAGNDYLEGETGADHFIGGSGADQFYVSDQGFGLFGARMQTIRDFTSGEDVILLDNALFTNLGAEGTLDAAAFHSGSGAGAVAQTAEHRIIYNEDNGRLYYDPDGAGGDDQTFVLRLGNASTEPEAGDFVVV